MLATSGAWTTTTRPMPRAIASAAKPSPSTIRPASQRGRRAGLTQRSCNYIPVRQRRGARSRSTRPSANGNPATGTSGCLWWKPAPSTARGPAAERSRSMHRIISLPKRITNVVERPAKTDWRPSRERFGRAGLLDRTVDHRLAGRPVPKLERLLDTNKRVVVVAEDNDHDLPYGDRHTRDEVPGNQEIAAVSKTVGRASVPRVQIPPLSTG